MQIKRCPGKSKGGDKQSSIHLIVKFVSKVLHSPSGKLLPLAMRKLFHKRLHSMCCRFEALLERSQPQ